MLTPEDRESKREAIAGGQQVDIPREAAEDEGGLRAREQEIVERINGLAEVAQQRASGRYRTIQDMTNLYFDRWPWTGKETWQSKVWIPRLFQTTESIVSLYTSGLIPGKPWFNAEDAWRGEYARVWLIENLMLRMMDRLGFLEMVRLALITGFIGGTIPVKVAVDSTRRIPEPSMVLLDPVDLMLDWSGRQRFVICDTEVDPWTLREWAEMGMFEEDRVGEVLAAAQGEWAKGAPRRDRSWDEGGLTIQLREFWGDLASRDGELWAGDCTCIVANGRHLLRPPRENPFDKVPIVLGQPLRVPYKVWAPGLLEHNSGLAKMLTELACGVLDAALLASIQAYQYDVERIDPATLLRGIYPGKAIGVTDLTGQGDGIRAFEPGKVPHDVLGVMEVLSLEIERGTQVAEHTAGFMRPGGRRRTAREVERYLGQSMSIIKTMAKDLELSFFAPLLERVLWVWANVTARHPAAFYRPELVKAVGAAPLLVLSRMPASRRAEVLTRDMLFRVHGMSGALALGEELQRLLALVAAMRADPEMWGMVNKRKLAQRLIEVHRQDPEALLYTPEEMQQMAARQAIVQQGMMAQAAMQGARPGGRMGPGAWRPRAARPPEPMMAAMARGQAMPGELGPMAAVA